MGPEEREGGREGESRGQTGANLAQFRPVVW